MNVPIHDTVQVTRSLNASLNAVWEAYADVSQRVRWAVPEGEGMVYETSDFREGGRDRYRCGESESLEFYAEVEYTRIVPRETIVYVETVTMANLVLGTSLMTWHFESQNEDEDTVVTVTSQIVSFVGAEMITGNRNGHTAVLEQLERLLARD